MAAVRLSQESNEVVIYLAFVTSSSSKCLFYFSFPNGLGQCYTNQA